MNFLKWGWDSRWDYLFPGLLSLSNRVIIPRFSLQIRWGREDLQSRRTFFILVAPTLILRNQISTNSSINIYWVPTNPSSLDPNPSFFSLSPIWMTVMFLWTNGRWRSWFFVWSSFLPLPTASFHIGTFYLRQILAGLVVFHFIFCNQTSRNNLNHCMIASSSHIQQNCLWNS